MKGLSLSDKWIITRLSKLIESTNEKFEKYEIKLQNINGIFGNENGIIVAIKNEDKGLDIIQIN